MEGNKDVTDYIVGFYNCQRQHSAWKAQTRLCGCYRKFAASGKLKVQACTAIARELAGFIWAIGQALPQPAAGK